MRRSRTALLCTSSALILLASAGCASGGAASGAPRQDPDVLTADQIDADADAGLDVLTLLQRRRPRWLQARGSMTFGGQTTASVIVDGVNRGGVGYLRGLPAHQVEEIRYLGAGDATTRYGMDMAGGAILVTLRH